MLPLAVARSSSDHNAISCVLPVLWMTSFLHNGYLARGVGNIDVGVVLQHVVKLSNVFVGGATLFNFVVVYNGNKMRTGDEV